MLEALKQEPTEEVEALALAHIIKEDPGIKTEGPSQTQAKPEPAEQHLQQHCPADAGANMLVSRVVGYAGPYPQWAAPSAAACHQVAERLAAVHGWPSLQRKAQPGQPQVGCEERRSVLDSLVRTLLSQNTTDVTSGRAFSTLKQRFPTWGSVLAAPVAEVADAIRVGGLADIKAARIQAILQALVSERGECSLEHLRVLPTTQVKAELGRYKGVGKKTVSCVLLFALERQDFAVDTHVWEITKSLGWVPTNCSRDQAYDHLNERVPDELKYDLHVLLVRHGKACPACAKAGSAKAKAAGGVDCPLAGLKPPKSQLKAAATGGKGKGRQQQPKGSEDSAAVPAAKSKSKAAAKDAGEQQCRQQGGKGSTAAAAAAAAAAASSRLAASGSKRRKIVATD